MQQHIFASEEMSFSDVSLYIPDSLRNCCQAQIKDFLLPCWMQFCQWWLCHDCNGMSLYSDHPCNKATQCHRVNGLICSLFRPGREPERRHSSYYPNISCGVARTPSHGSDYAKFRDARQTNTMQNAKHLTDRCSMHEKSSNIKREFNFLVSMASLKEPKAES